jgi:hypothetical protein
MKIRQGFVSNSSSCSFAICLDKLSEDQIKKIMKYAKSSECEGNDDSYDGDGEWYVEVNKPAGILHGSNQNTYGDRLFSYMREIGVPDKIVASLE